MNRKYRQYISPNIQVRDVRIEMYASSIGMQSMDLNHEKFIEESTEILTKPRSFFDDEASFKMDEW